MEHVYDEEIIELVVARLQVLPEGAGISVGAEGDFSKEDIINHVRNGDDIGQKIIDAELHFLRTLKEGSFYVDTFDNTATA